MVNPRKEMSNIAVIGFMATGKTTISKELSENLNMEFIDVDKFIEEKTKMTISEIFEKHGEEYFREIEKKSLEGISSLENMVISCGGGVCLNPENIINIRKNSLVILLEADPETIIKRIERDESRPLLRDKKNKEDIKRIMDSRKDSYYKAADIIIDTNNKSILNIRDEIIKKIGK